MQRRKNGLGATITSASLTYNYYLKRYLTILEQEQLNAARPKQRHRIQPADDDESIQSPSFMKCR